MFPMQNTEDPLLIVPESTTAGLGTAVGYSASSSSPASTAQSAPCPIPGLLFYGRLDWNDALEYVRKIPADYVNWYREGMFTPEQQQATQVPCPNPGGSRGDWNMVIKSTTAIPEEYVWWYHEHGRSLYLEDQQRWSKDISDRLRFVGPAESPSMQERDVRAELKSGYLILNGREVPIAPGELRFGESAESFSAQKLDTNNDELNTGHFIRNGQKVPIDPILLRGTPMPHELRETLITAAKGFRSTYNPQIKTDPVSVQPDHRARIIKQMCKSPVGNCVLFRELQKYMHPDKPTLEACTQFLNSLFAHWTNILYLYSHASPSALEQVPIWFVAANQERVKDDSSVKMAGEYWGVLRNCDPELMNTMGMSNLRLETTLQLISGINIDKMVKHHPIDRGDWNRLIRDMWPHYAFQAWMHEEGCMVGKSISNPAFRDLFSCWSMALHFYDNAGELHLIPRWFMDKYSSRMSNHDTEEAKLVQQYYATITEKASLESSSSPPTQPQIVAAPSQPHAAEKMMDAISTNSRHWNIIKILQNQSDAASSSHTPPSHSLNSDNMEHRVHQSYPIFMSNQLPEIGTGVQQPLIKESVGTLRENPHESPVQSRHSMEFHRAAVDFQFKKELTKGEEQGATAMRGNGIENTGHLWSIIQDMLKIPPVAERLEMDLLGRSTSGPLTKHMYAATVRDLACRWSNVVMMYARADALNRVPRWFIKHYETAPDMEEHERKLLQLYHSGAESAFIGGFLSAIDTFSASSQHDDVPPALKNKMIRDTDHLRNIILEMISFPPVAKWMANEVSMLINPGTLNATIAYEATLRYLALHWFQVLLIYDEADAIVQVPEWFVNQYGSTAEHQHELKLVEKYRALKQQEQSSADSHKLKSYKLDYVAEHFMNLRKQSEPPISTAADDCNLHQSLSKVDDRNLSKFLLAIDRFSVLNPDLLTEAPVSGGSNNIIRDPEHLRSIIREMFSFPPIAAWLNANLLGRIVDGVPMGHTYDAALRSLAVRWSDVLNVYNEEGAITRVPEWFVNRYGSAADITAFERSLVEKYRSLKQQEQESALAELLEENEHMQNFIPEASSSSSSSTGAWPLNMHAHPARITTGGMMELLADKIVSSEKNLDDAQSSSSGELESMTGVTLADLVLRGQGTAREETGAASTATEREFILEDFTLALGRLPEPSESVPDRVPPSERLRIVEHMFSLPETRKYLLNQASANMMFGGGVVDACERTLGSLFEAWSNVGLVYDWAHVKEQMPEWFPKRLRPGAVKKEESYGIAQKRPRCEKCNSHKFTSSIKSIDEEKFTFLMCQICQRITKEVYEDDTTKNGSMKGLSERDVVSRQFQEAADSFRFKDEVEADPTTVMQEHRQRIIHNLFDIPQVYEHLLAKEAKHNENNEMQDGAYRCCIELLAPWTNVLHMCKSLGVLNLVSQEFVDAHRKRAPLSEEDAQLVGEYYRLIAHGSSRGSVSGAGIKPSPAVFSSDRDMLCNTVSTSAAKAIAASSPVQQTTPPFVLADALAICREIYPNAAAEISGEWLITHVCVAEDRVRIVEHMHQLKLGTVSGWLKMTVREHLCSAISDMFEDWENVLNTYERDGALHMAPDWFIKRYRVLTPSTTEKRAKIAKILERRRKLQNEDAPSAESVTTWFSSVSETNVSLADEFLATEQASSSSLSQLAVAAKTDNVITLDELLEAVSEFGTLTSQLPHSVPVDADDRARIVRHMCETQPRAIGWLQGRGVEIVPGANVREFMVNMMSLLLSDWVMVLDSYQMDNMLAHIPRWFIDKYQEQIKPGDSREARIRHVIKSYMGLIDELYEMDDSEVESMDALFALGQSTKSHDVLSVVQSAAASSAMVSTVNRRLEAIAFGKLFCGTR